VCVLCVVCVRCVCVLCLYESYGVREMGQIKQEMKITSSWSVTMKGYGYERADMCNVDTLCLYVYVCVNLTWSQHLDLFNLFVIQSNMLKGYCYCVVSFTTPFVPRQISSSSDLLSGNGP